MISKRMFLSVLIVIALSVAFPIQMRTQVKHQDRSRTARRSLRPRLSPTAALRAYYQAAINKDSNTARKYLSASSLALMEVWARSMGKSLDQAFREDVQQSTTVMPRFISERIRGGTATVNIRMPMVKENGEWKLALDKLIEGMGRTQSATNANVTPSTATKTDRTYSEDEKHRLFQTVGMLEDNALIIEVARKIGIVDSHGQPRANFQAFVNEHYDWATRNADFIRQYMDKAKAREYVMANK